MRILSIFNCQIFTITSGSFITIVTGGPGVLVAENDEHNRQRKQLNPMFSAANTRDMTGGMYEVAHRVSRFS